MKVRIAIAEDHDLLRAYICQFIASFDFLEVSFEAVNGQVLLDKLVVNPVDLVILDLRMPVMDGYQTLMFLKRSYPNIKVIIFSSSIDEIKTQYLLNCGASACIDKNNHEELIPVIRILFNLSNDF